MKLNKTKYYYYNKSSLGKIVTRISNKEDYQKYIDSHNGTALSIPKDTIKINRNIFNNINNIKKISLPSSLKKIDVKCFGKYIGIKINYDNLYEIILKNMSPEGKYEKCLRIDRIYNQRKFINEIKLMNLENSVNVPINIGNPTEKTINEIAIIIKKLVGSNSKIIHCEAMKDDSQTRKPNIGLANNILKWEPKISLESGIKKCIEYFKKV